MARSLWAVLNVWGVHLDHNSYRWNRSPYFDLWSLANIRGSEPLNAADVEKQRRQIVTVEQEYDQKVTKRQSKT
jgi:hypothetical protein